MSRGRSGVDTLEGQMLESKCDQGSTFFSGISIASRHTDAPYRLHKNVTTGDAKDTRGDDATMRGARAIAGDCRRHI